MNTTELALFEALEKENTELKETIASLKAQIKLLQKMIFGKKSEKMVPKDNQPTLFDLPPFVGQKEEQAQEQIVAAHVRRQPKRDGQDALQFPEDLPVETTVLDLPEEEKICPETGVPLVKIGEEVTDKLAKKSAHFFIKRTIRPKYANPKNEEAGVQTKALPDAIIPRCRADESLLAHVVTQKFVDHLPLYRISSMLEREGIFISRKLLSQWVIRLGRALKPLKDLMLKKILSSKNVFIDESPVRFLEDESKQGYMWVLVGGKGPNPPYRVYLFRENRRHEHVIEILQSYDGCLHSDKYGAYEKLAEQKQFTWMPCWVHIRRKFLEAEGGDHSFTEWILSEIKKLFDLEQCAWKCTEEERLKIRLEEEVPVIDALIAKVKERLVSGYLLPKSKFKEALCYFFSLTPYLKNYTKHPNTRLDNNVAERAIRPLALGRKNWLFFGSAEAGESAATLLSLVQTCQGLKINPEKYLEDIFIRFMSHSFHRLGELLPDVWMQE